MAPMPSSAVRANMSLSRAAPSSMEYSVCTCRWTNESRDPAADMGWGRPFLLDGAHDEPGRRGPRPCLWGEVAQPTGPDDEIVPRPTDSGLGAPSTRVSAGRLCPRWASKRRSERLSQRLAAVPAVPGVDLDPGVDPAPLPV